jgi:hypothetical protein
MLLRARDHVLADSRLRKQYSGCLNESIAEYDGMSVFIDLHTTTRI